MHNKPFGSRAAGGAWTLWGSLQHSSWTKGVGPLARGRDEGRVWQRKRGIRERKCRRAKRG